MSADGSLLAKIWNSHVVTHLDDETDLLYIDLHLVQEVSSPQAFAGLRQAARSVRRPSLTVAVMDHVVPTGDRSLRLTDERAELQLQTLADNCKDNAITLHGLDSPAQGIAHVVAPEQGLVLPGMTVVCGDSHTSTLGAFGCLAFGIGTSEVEHVLATQTLVQRRPRLMAVEVDGRLPDGTAAKDLILSIVAQLGVSGGSGHAIEYSGECIASLSMEARMTVCNMSIEAGARIGMVAPDSTTYEYLRQRAGVAQGDRWREAVTAWSALPSDDDVRFDQHLHVDASAVVPTVTWGTTPAMSAPITGHVPRPAETADPAQTDRALRYMGLQGGERITDIAIDRVFIGSCTNSRIEDLRATCRVIGDRHVAAGVRAMIVPGSVPVKRQAESEGLDEVFRAAGFEWREPGCSMCVGMNGDTLAPGERCASTSNRNFEGRQGVGGRTHLVSPEMAAAAAVTGRFIDVRSLLL